MTLRQGSVRAGYKKTEVGVIPEDWEICSVGELASFSSGCGISISALSPQSSETPFPVYGGNGIAGYTVKPFVKALTVIVGRVGQKCGEVYLSTGPSWVTDNALYPRIIFKNIDIIFFSLALKAAGLNNVKNKNDLPLVTQSILHSVQIPIPPTLAEQTAIATALSDTDELIQSLEKLIAKKRAIKQGAMQELLTGKKRLPGFEGKWEEKRLGEYLLKNPDYGINAPAVPYSDILPTYLRITDISEDGSFFHKGKVSVDNINSAQYFLDPDDIVFARTGASVGKTYLHNPKNGRLVFAGFLIRVKVDSTKLNARFLKGFLETKVYWNWVTVMSMRSGQPGINGNEYSQLPIPMPPSVEEQIAIAAILTDMDSELSALEAKLSKYRTIKQGIMQELLTGKTRLNH